MAYWIRCAKTCLMAAAAAFLFAGCAGRPLVEREIVRAIFFAKEGGSSHAVLLLQDQQSEDSSDYNVASGKGDTPAQALADAEAGLDGVMFYGLTDLVALPFHCSWEELQGFAALLYETAQPSPEITLFLLDDRTVSRLQETAGQLYDEMQAAEKKYQLCCGLESVLCQGEEAELPCWQGNDYGFAVLCRGQQTIRYVEPVRAQLAAVLSGQSRQLEFVFADDSISCRTSASVLVQAQSSQTCVFLRLEDTSLTALTDQVPRGEEQLRQLLAEELQNAFSQMCTDLKAMGADPFRLSFWQTCLQGKPDDGLPAVLSVEFA